MASSGLRFVLIHSSGWLSKLYLQIKRYEVKVKQSRNRPGVAQGVPGGSGSQIFKKLGT